MVYKNLFDLSEVGMYEKRRYSYMKLGQKEQIKHYAHNLHLEIEKTLKEKNIHPESVVIVCPGTGENEVPNSISHIAMCIAGKNKYSYYILNNNDKPGSYEDLPYEERDKLRGFIEPSCVTEYFQNKTIVLIDDSIVSGGTIKKAASVLSVASAEILIFAIAKIQTERLSIEGDLNRTIIDKSGVNKLAELWNDNKNYTTSKLVKYTQEYGTQKVIDSLTPTAALNLYIAYLIYFKENLPDCFNGVVKSLKKQDINVFDEEKLNIWLERRSICRRTYSSFVYHRFSKDKTFRINNSKSVKDLFLGI